MTSDWLQIMRDALLSKTEHKWLINPFMLAAAKVAIQF